MSALRPLTFLLRRVSGGFILAFHTIPPDRFTEFIESLEGFAVVPLSELVTRNKIGRSTSGLCAITVDDGVGDNVRSLAAVMQARGWPGTFYLPTAYLDTREPMPFQWYSKIAPILPAAAICVGSEIFDLARPEGLRNLTNRLELAWRTQPSSAYLPLIDQLLDFVEHDLGIQRTQLQAPEPITWEEVRQLSRCELIRFESHGRAHSAVSSMSELEIAVEMRESRSRIEQHTGVRCHHFCYPFGSPESIGSVAPRVAQGFYESAVTMDLGGVDGCDPWLLPRIPVYPENSPGFFQLKIALRCSRTSSMFKKKDEPAGPRQARPQAQGS